MLSGRRLERQIRAFDRELALLERPAIARLDGHLRFAAGRLEAELRRLYGVALTDLKATDHRLLREARARLLLEQVRAGLDLTTGAQANSVFTGLLTESFDLGARNALTVLGEYQQQLVTLSSNARLTVAARATQASARLAHHGADFALKAEQLVVDGIVRGRGWGRVATELRRETGVTRWKAEQIVRTESVSAGNDARTATYAENGVEHGQWVSVMDSVVCGYCAERSGKVYRLEDIVIPAHPGCRCYTSPWKREWAELGLTDDDWYREHHETAMSKTKAKPTGSKPSPFERSSGLEKAPEAVWSP